MFDTDMGNDIDDALALAVIHSLERRGECRLLGVTLTKDNPWAAPFVDLVNTFYGRGEIPIGVVRDGKTPEDDNYIRAIAEKKAPDGSPLYPHDLTDGRSAPEAVGLLRKLLASQPDHSVVDGAGRIQHESGPPAGFAGRCSQPARGPANWWPAKCACCRSWAARFRRCWPSTTSRSTCRPRPSCFPNGRRTIVASGFEIGEAVLYPGASIEHDFRYVEHHPVADAYRAYEKMPYDRPSWDLTAVLYAVRPERGYFNLSPPGDDPRRIQAGFTRFTPDKNGKHRFLDPDRRAACARQGGAG